MRSNKDIERGLWIALHGRTEMQQNQTQPSAASQVLALVSIVAITLVAAYYVLLYFTGVDTIAFLKSVREYNETQATAQVQQPTAYTVPPTRVQAAPAAPAQPQVIYVYQTAVPAAVAPPVPTALPQSYAPNYDTSRNAGGFAEPVVATAIVIQPVIIKSADGSQRTYVTGAGACRAHGVARCAP